MESLGGAVVTGSTSGIGLACAHRLASAGYDVMLNGFGAADAIEQTRQGLEKASGRRVVFHGADLTKPDQCADLIASAKAHFGKVDVLVNNAGTQHVSPVEDFPLEKWDLIIALNLSAVFHTTRAVFADMKARGAGRIINIASAHALVASPFKSAYVATKHGVAGFTKSTALEGAKFGVRVNAVCPGYVLTPLVEQQIPDTMAARGLTREQVINDVLLAAQPTKEFVTPEQVAELVHFLTTEAARGINGAMLSVDGGWVAQ